MHRHCAGSLVVRDKCEQAFRVDFREVLVYQYEDDESNWLLATMDTHWSEAHYLGTVSTCIATPSPSAKDRLS